MAKLEIPILTRVCGIPSIETKAGNSRKLRTTCCYRSITCPPIHPLRIQACRMARIYPGHMETLAFRFRFFGRSRSEQGQRHHMDAFGSGVGIRAVAHQYHKERWIPLPGIRIRGDFVFRIISTIWNRHLTFYAGSADARRTLSEGFSAR